MRVILRLILQKEDLGWEVRKLNQNLVHWQDFVLAVLNFRILLSESYLNIKRMCRKGLVHFFSKKQTPEPCELYCTREFPALFGTNMVKL